MARTLQQKQGWIGWLFFTDLWAGLGLTLRYMFARTVTHMYPDHEKWIPYSRYRGHHFINTNSEGDVNCVGCELCSKICPCDCITVVPFEDAKGNRRPKTFEINLARCLYCGLCEDACPADAIKLGQDYELSRSHTDALIVQLEDLVIAPRKAEDYAGTVIKASLESKDSTQTIAQDNSMKGHDWWQLLRREK